MLELVAVALTAAIAVAAGVRAADLLRGDSVQVERLREFGATGDRAHLVVGLTLATLVVGLVLGWWIRPLGIISIVAIKLGYAATLIARRRRGLDRSHEWRDLLMTSHSVVALGLLLAW